MKTFKIEIPKGYQVDEEKSTFTNIVFKPIEKKWVDLGLPSGTLWANNNEDGYYSYQEAIDTFDKNNLPKLTDFAELYDYCTWTWDSNLKSMIVTGPNGRHIVFPASGYRIDSNSELHFVDHNGSYWSVSPYGNYAYSLDFDDNGDVNPSYDSNCEYKFSIRKIKRK